MGFIDRIKERAKQDKKTIVLPESMDRRTWEAVEIILKEGIADIIVLGTPEECAENSKGLDVAGATVIDPHTAPELQSYIDKLV
ncbi:MAG: phosphate acetyltransferase, partial [Lachnospiraceae bacterium]|nr:phosphate acetyltransferase [Lachnospiraceae bacterium]